MKKNYLLIVLVLFSFTLFSQKDQPHYNQLPPSLLYGSKFLQNSYFNEQLNSFTKLKFNGPITFVGLCASEEVQINPRNRLQNHTV